MPKLAIVSAPFACCLLLVAACAVGDEDPEIDQGIVPTIPTEAGSDATIDYVPPKPIGMTDAGADANVDAAQEAGAIGKSCAPRTDCAGGEDLGSLSGDNTGSPIASRTVTRTGDTSAWFKFTITEDIPFPLDLKLKADLIGPPTGAGPGPNFALYLYVANNTTTNACSVAPRAASGDRQSVAITIPDTSFSSDNRDVYVEVRETGRMGANACTASSTWALTIVTAE